MDKRGQFYIILAIVFSLLFLTIVMPVNIVQEAILIQDFNEVSNNYVQEAPKAANYGIFNDKDTRVILTGYTKDFLTFARQRNPSIELIYIYNNGTNVTVQSYAKESIVVETGQETKNLFSASEETINNINLKVAGKDFTQQVPLQIKNFGDQFYTTDFPSAENVVLNIGGVFHNFDLGNQGPEFNVWLRSSNGQIKQVYSTGTGKELNVKI
ncbi:MAG: hypothetical protein AABW41_02430 [Nanoarchaeota archaeon]